MNVTQGERIARLETRQDRIEADIAHININLEKLTNIFQHGRGSWTVVVALLGLAGAIVVGLIIAALTNYLFGKGG